ncbi:MAG: excinuclease ABC subunit UvrC [Clostridia bacterium]|nr:excinuclease ABC subunit UvrC [Clostridia bacterium]MBQ8720125.1 excinuclease ABC subunit UvrC [Clostridia bacterium]
MTRLERLRAKANSLPLVPGVYIMKSADGGVIYVGKSKKLKNRVTSYFLRTASHSPKTARMVSLVEDFDYIVCDTEIEALALENVLIKRHSPKYNIKLKDAKSYPYIKMTNEEFPRLFVTRERKGDKSAYFGPYSGSSTAHAALDAVVQVFALPTCKRSFPKDIGKERPCIFKEMKRCVAPCDGSIDAESYRALTKSAGSVLSGNISETERQLTEKMTEAAELMEFERAAALRDSISALKRLSEKQKVVADAKVMRDIFAIYSSPTGSAFAALTVRCGALVNKNEFILTASEPPTSEEMATLIADYYGEGDAIPKEIMIANEIEDEDQALLSDYLSELAGRRVTVRLPERGEGRALCDMAMENAREAARQHRLTAERENRTLRRLCELLALDSFPSKIEAYDISNIGNESIVASMVVVRDGRLKKADYRLFNIKTTGGADDYGSMREALSRRLSHIGDGSPSLGEAPDLILLDGGVGQVSAVREVMRELKLDIPLFGMVKDDYHKTRAITDGVREISIALEADVYAFIYQIQEEAHRFAIKSSQKSKIKTLTSSTLEKIDGIGKARARALLSAMPLSKIRTASVEELMKVKGISRKNAELIYARFHKGGTTPC